MLAHTDIKIFRRELSGGRVCDWITLQRNGGSTYALEGLGLAEGSGDTVTPERMKYAYGRQKSRSSGDHERSSGKEPMLLLTQHLCE